METIQQPPQRLVQRVTHCSFCRQPGHRIKNCSSSELLNIFLMFKNKFNILMQNGSTSFGTEMDVFMSNFGMNKLRAVSIRFCSSRSTDTIQKMKNDIMQTLENNYMISTMTTLTHNTNHLNNNNRFNNYLMREYGDALINQDNLISNNEFAILWQRRQTMDIRYISIERTVTVIIDTEEEKIEKPNIKIYLNETNEVKDDDLLLMNCCICLNDDILKKESVKTNCHHEFCNGCLKNWVNSNHQNCPICRSEINKVYVNFSNNFDSWKSIVREN